uniref:B-cell receptor CD22 n=1 Tax=Paramormyrops kingsleyae TaxID=1676925 RepID=A0A3B3Q9B3_9TELE
MAQWRQGKYIAFLCLNVMFTFYSINPLCAIRGSTVVIPCSYKHPASLRVETVMWCLDDEICDKMLYVSHSSNTNISAEYRGRAEYLGNKEKNCTLQIKNITHKHAGVYTFRFTTNEKTGKWKLKVVMTSSRVNGAIREGDTVNLTCGTDSCSLSQSEFSWFKDNQTLPETQSTLHFSPISYHHTGKYSCALNGRKVAVSNEINVMLNVILPWSCDLANQRRAGSDTDHKRVQCELVDGLGQNANAAQSHRSGYASRGKTPSRGRAFSEDKVFRPLSSLMFRQLKNPDNSININKTALEQEPAPIIH